MFLLRAGEARGGGRSQVTRLTGHYGSIRTPTWRSKLTSRLPQIDRAGIYAALGSQRSGGLQTVFS